METNPVLYRDENLEISESGITIFHYYFPFGKPKKIAWSEIKEFKRQPLTVFVGKYRAWGMGFQLYWFNMGDRLDKKEFISIDTGKLIKSAVTPNDVNRVFELIQQHTKV
jgi:hypothetical protein